MVVVIETDRQRDRESLDPGGWWFGNGWQFVSKHLFVVSFPAKLWFVPNRWHRSRSASNSDASPASQLSPYRWDSPECRQSICQPKSTEKFRIPERKRCNEISTTNAPINVLYILGQELNVRHYQRKWHPISPNRMEWPLLWVWCFSSL